MAAQQLDNRNNNLLNYSKISFEDSLAEISTIIKLQSPKVMDFFASSTGRMLLELFSAYTELSYRGIETGLTEGYSLTATKFSSAVTNSRSMGYSIRRPTSASTSFYVALAGAAGAYAGSFTIPKFTVFSLNGSGFISLDDYTFKWDSTGKVESPANGTSIIQGYRKTVRFTAVEGKLFQTFKIADSTFSDYFGDLDPLKDSPANQRITTVEVDGVAWDIDRRSLYNPDKSTSPSSREGKLYKSTNKKCLISTNADGDVEVMFGDGIISEVPSGDIVVTYLSSAGSAGAVYNSKDLKLNLTSSDIAYSPVNSLNDSNLAFYLNESALGGADLESVQSINHNTPKIYAALDRAITVDDYKAILLTMPNVAHALAYGEDQLGPGDYRYFNVVLFTVIDALYKGAQGAIAPTTPSDYIISGFNTLAVAQSFQDAGTQNKLIKSTFDSKFTLSSYENDVYSQLKYSRYITTLGSVLRLTSQNIDSSSELGNIMRVLKTKAQATVRHLYFPSKVHKYRMKAEIYVNPISSKNTIANDVQQKAFSYLKDNTFFNFPIYSSKIVKIIESLPSIIGCHVSFVPFEGIPTDSTVLDILLTESDKHLVNLVDSLNQLQRRAGVVLFPVLSSDDDEVYTANIIAKRNAAFSYYSSNLINYQNMNEKNISNFINYVWEQTLGRMILNPNVLSGSISNINDFIGPASKSGIESGGLLNTGIDQHIFDTFIEWAVQFRNDTDYYSAKYVIDSKGDISNFRLPNEIAQIEIDPVNDIVIQTRTF